LLSKNFPEDPNHPGLFSARDVPVRINRVGRLGILVQATLFTKIFPVPTVPGAPPQPVPGGNKGFTLSPFNFDRVLLDPDGIPFVKDSVTPADLNRYRDLRGFVRPWTLRIMELNQPPNDGSHIVGPQIVSVEVHETIASSSAAPLVDVHTTMSNGQREFEFDLYRVGRLIAKVTKDVTFPFESPAAIRVTLFRPDGSVMAHDDDGNIGKIITLLDLQQSRGPDGAVRKWKLRVEAANNTKYKVFAQVFGTVRIPVSVLQKRFDSLLGTDGNHLTIGANWNDERDTNQITLRINDQQLAETFGLHDVLKDLDPEIQRPNFHKEDLENPVTGLDYVMSEDSLVFRTGFNRAQGECRNIKSTSFKIKMGASVERRPLKEELVAPGPHPILRPTGAIIIPPNLPRFLLELVATGFIHVVVNNSDDGDLIITKLRLEIGLDVSSEGRLIARCWLDPDSLKFGGEEGTIHQPIVNVENRVKLKLQGKNENLTLSFTHIFEDVFDRLMGGAFRFTTTRFTGTAMEFDYVAGVEPERRPNPGYVARGDFGVASGPNGPITPNHIDTWKSPNLAADKIEHIIVLMMENRSFDHVLGYLSLENPPVVNSAAAFPPVLSPLNGAINPDVDGLTNQIITKFSENGTSIRHLSKAGFAANDAGLKTKLPLGVGHSFEDVKQQLARQTMTGFAANFATKIAKAPNAKGCKPQDALGYYTASDLAMYEFLSREFAICDRYFCSHPGPTLPTRMYSLTGDLQRDRHGEPRFNNGVDSTFFLSRDQTIFDVLEQKGVPWRVYESVPSVTMLRMFSRYAGDETHIRDIRKLKKDIADSKGSVKFPAVTFIDPAMHDGPPNDDHPPADMLHGQHLIRDVYKAIRANDALWKKTMLIVTYDEHGGFFDHVPPAVAEVFQDPRKFQDPPTVSPSPASNEPGTGAVTDVTDGDDLVTNPDAGTSRPRHLPNEEVIYGVRVPTLIISPWVAKGSVFKRLVDHTSILKTILVKFCGTDRPFFSDRVHHALDFGPALTLTAPRDVTATLPVLPNLSDSDVHDLKKAFHIIRKRDITGKDSDSHDWMEALSRLVRP
jgi:phospholipase C